MTPRWELALELLHRGHHYSAEVTRGKVTRFFRAEADARGHLTQGCVEITRTEYKRAQAEFAHDQYGDDGWLPDEIEDWIRLEEEAGWKGDEFDAYAADVADEVDRWVDEHYDDPDRDYDAMKEDG